MLLQNVGLLVFQIGVCEVKQEVQLYLSLFDRLLTTALELGNP